MNYFQPNDLNSALDVLKNNSDLTIAAGCTDLFPITNNMSLDKNILDITNIKSIKGFQFNNKETKIGSATTWTDIINENLPSCYDMLKACAKEVGSIQIQNLGTIGGNICNASPAADSIPCLLALDAKLELSSTNNQRIIPIDEFILGSRKTKLEKDEILTSIIIFGLSETWLVVLFSVVYLLGVQGITIAIHIPLNNQIQKVLIEELNDEAIKDERVKFERKWNYFNNIRTSISILVSLLLLILLSLR